jgi:hypothetical protein
MSTLHELGNAVHARRPEMGLTQARLRKILEAGTVTPDDAPISLLASLAEQLRREAGSGRARQHRL